ncbi:MAG: tautomerase family protein [Desulfarculus sp.]|nr:tautomerase family protein [Desulfarculus sp.]
MPVIIVKARQGVLPHDQAKAQIIKDMAHALARAVGDEAYQARATVIIEEYPDQNWGRGGKQVDG